MNSRSFSFFITILQKQVDTLPTDDKQITQRQYYEGSFLVRRKLAFSTPYVYARVTYCI